jgi:predicted Zn-dependent protease
MRKVLLILMCCTAALLTGYAGYRSYKVWKQQHFVRLAREFIAKSDVRNAVLCLSKVLASNPQQPEAIHLMASLTDATRSPSAVLWHTRAVEINPHSVEDRLTLAESALLFQDINAATNALEGVDQADRQTGQYQNLAGRVAAAANNHASAESHFREAIRLEPQNPSWRLNLAVEQVHGTNQSAMAEAINSLQSISKNPTNSYLRCLALRELIVHADHDKQTNAEVAFSRQLLLETNSDFSDKVVQLGIFHQTKNTEFPSTLHALQQEAASEPRKLQELATWEMMKYSPAETLKWLQKLPPKTLTNQPAAAIVAECDTMIHDWRGLQSFLEPQNWAELEFVRHAFKSLALREQGLTDAGKSEWSQALKTAKREKQPLIMLLRLTVDWRWLSESEELLWSLVNTYPSEKWAANALEEDLFLNGRTRPLLEFYSQGVKRAPSNFMLKNNLAMTALLLGANELHPDVMAREVYNSNPTNAAFASTYAYCLLLQKKNEEALKVLERLRPEQLEDPSISGYYGLALEATGNAAKAKKYLKLTDKARVLPEERKLFDRGSVGS